MATTCPDEGAAGQFGPFRDQDIGIVLQVLALPLQNRGYTGAADKAVNLVGCKSPTPIAWAVVSISDACGGKEACSARK